MAYNFATKGYSGFITPNPSIDTAALRKQTVHLVQNFNPKAWHDEPVKTILSGEPVHAEGDVQIETVDAFGRVNGKQLLASPGVVDRVIAQVHEAAALPASDFRGPVRSIEDTFFSLPLAASLVANQALDFQKQDGVTEIEEATQALLVERHLNDALYEDELSGKIKIGRAAAFVGCVSNFTNFLDLCRKMLRNMELGVPVVVLSRSNTTQHMYRYTVQLLDLMKKHGLDLRLCTYCSCSIEEQRRLLAACPDSPMYFTGNRTVAKRIKEVAPRLVASTGGPNTMVVGPGCFTPEVAEAARMSNMIEHKGQCTALRHMVVPGMDEGTIQEMYQKQPVSKDAAESLARKEFSALLKGLAEPVAEGYKVLQNPGAPSSGKVAYRMSKTLPNEIDEMWREAYLDVTAPDGFTPEFTSALAAWLNREQPISLAFNSDLKMARSLFENTAVVVYTWGSVEDKRPALTAQARPQDGECFGEFPPRRELEAVTSFPVIIPSSTPGYNSAYTKDFLKSQGAAPLDAWGFPAGLEGGKALVRRCKSPEEKGYLHVLLDYLLDATTGPHRGCGARTALFGLQRPPLHGGLCCLRLEKVSGPNLPHTDALFDAAARYIFPFMATNAKEQLVISLDPFLSFPAYPMLQQQGLKVVRESKEAFLAEEASYWNVVTLPRDPASPTTSPEFPLAAQFVSKLFPMGHVKSTRENDEAFVAEFSSSQKWLRMVAGSKI